MKHTNHDGNRPRRTLWLRAGALVMLLAALTGCEAAFETAIETAIEQSDDLAIDDVNITEDGITIEGDEGTIQVGGDAPLPEGLTIPVPDGGTVVSSIAASPEDGAFTFALVEYPAEDLDRLIEFYGEETNFERSDFESEVGATVVYADADTQSNVTITDSNGTALLSITQGG